MGRATRLASAAPPTDDAAVPPAAAHCASLSSSSSPPVPPSPFLPTPPDVVAELLNVALAGLSPSATTVLDIGCGDGRVAIAAAARGASGIGVESLPHVFERALATRAAA